MNATADAKLNMMKSSTLCLIFGLLALLPFIGFIFGVAALVISVGVRQVEKRFWNPARHYRLCGTICGIVSLLMWGGLLAFIIAKIAINVWF